MKLVRIYCPTAPAWHPLPPEGVPDFWWIWGTSEPPKDLKEPGRLPLNPGHDIRLDEAGGRFRFQYTEGDNSWIILQYGEWGTKPCHACGEDISEISNFCPFCGVSQTGD